MADESKKYIINIESNLKKYSEEADAAAKKVAELKTKISGLSDEQKKDGAAVEALNAQYRTAQKEYSQAKKMVDLQTSANKSEAGSRKQLGEILRLQEQALGKLGSAYVVNAKGVRELNPLYVEQRKRIKETKDAIIEYDKSLGDGRSSVGLYSEALGGVGDNLLSMGKNLVGAGAIIGALTAVFNKLKEAIMSTTFAIDAMNQVQAISKQLFYDLAVHGEINIANLKNASAAQSELNTLRIEELQVNYRNAAQQKEINALMLYSADITKSDEDRLVALNKVREIDTEQTKIKVDLLHRQLLAVHQLREGQEDNEELLKEEYRIMTEIRNEQAKSDAAMRRVESQQAGIHKRQIAEAEKRNALLREEAELIRIAAELQAKKEAAMAEAEAFAAMVNEKKDYELRVAKERGEEEYAIRKKYADAEVEIAKLTNDEKLALASDFANNIAIIFGEQSAIGKAAAVVQTTIDTYVAAFSAYKGMIEAIPGPIGMITGIAAAAAATAAGVATVKKILAVDTGGQEAKVGMKASMPTAITASTPAQRSFAAPVGSTIFTQPQLSQTELNAMPGQSLLTADEIARALSNMPAPIVTVEDINAKVNQVNKINVRANI
jgi:hypothetical protein